MIQMKYFEDILKFSTKNTLWKNVTPEHTRCHLRTLWNMFRLDVKIFEKTYRSRKMKLIFYKKKYPFTGVL